MKKHSNRSYGNISPVLLIRANAVPLGRMRKAMALREEVSLH